MLRRRRRRYRRFTRGHWSLARRRIRRSYRWELPSFREADGEPVQRHLQKTRCACALSVLQRVAGESRCRGTGNAPRPIRLGSLQWRLRSAWTGRQDVRDPIQEKAWSVRMPDRRAQSVSRTVLRNSLSLLQATARIADCNSYRSIETVFDATHEEGNQRVDQPRQTRLRGNVIRMAGLHLVGVRRLNLFTLATLPNAAPEWDEISELGSLLE